MNFASEVFFRRFGGGAGIPKVTQIFAYGKSLCIYTMLLHGASDLDKRELNGRWKTLFQHLL